MIKILSITYARTTYSMRVRIGEHTMNEPNRYKRDVAIAVSHSCDYIIKYMISVKTNSLK